MEFAGSQKSELAGLNILIVQKQNRHFRSCRSGDLFSSNGFFRRVVRLNTVFYSLPRNVLLNSSTVSLPVTIRSKSELLT
jgi:hypothetical protein